MRPHSLPASLYVSSDPSTYLQFSLIHVTSTLLTWFSLVQEKEKAGPAITCLSPTKPAPGYNIGVIVALVDGHPFRIHRQTRMAAKQTDGYEGGN